MQIDTATAIAVLREEAENARNRPPVALWVKKLEELDRLCGKVARTHIAAFGTALLAKSVDPLVDVFALKTGRNGPRAYSARQLAKEALAALAPELEMDIGVYGREPLNNQPYFRESIISREMPVRPNARQALNYLVDLLMLVDKIGTTEQARDLLRTYITVRREHFRRPGLIGEVDEMSPADLLDRIRKFTAGSSEGGRRAQAVVAGLLDASVGEHLVRVGRINDPDTSLPGDVAILNDAATDGWRQVFEVRDKPVTEADLHHLVHKAATAGVDRVAMLALSSGQRPIEIEEAAKRASESGVGLVVRIGWESLLAEVIFWAVRSRGSFAAAAAQRVDARLVELDATPAAIALWRHLNSDVAQE